jgi:hypothetical protein
MTNDLTVSWRAAAEAYLERNRQALAVGGRARLIFALDATMSRSETRDVAATLQSEMFATLRRSAALRFSSFIISGSANLNFRSGPATHMIWLPGCAGFGAKAV